MNDFWSKGERLFAYIEDCPFIDIGVPDDYRRAAATLRRFSKKLNSKLGILFWQ